MLVRSSCPRRRLWLSQKSRKATQRPCAPGCGAEEPSGSYLLASGGALDAYGLLQLAQLAQSPFSTREGGDYAGIELAAGLGDDLFDRPSPRNRAPIRSIARHRIERVGDGEDPGAERNLSFRKAIRVTGAVPAFVVRTDDPKPLALKERDSREQLGADDRMPLDEMQLVLRQRAGLVHDPVGHPDLADVVKQEAILEARVVEKPTVDGLRQLERVALDTERVKARQRVFRLKRVGKSGHRLSIGMLEEPSLPPLDVDQAREVARIEEDLFIATSRGFDAELAACAGQPIDQAKELERAERLVQNPVRTGSLGLAFAIFRAREQDDDRRAFSIALQPPAERDPVRARKADVEDDDGRTPEANYAGRGLGRASFLDGELVCSEGRPEQQAQRRVVVDDEDATPPSKIRNGRDLGLSASRHRAAIGLEPTFLLVEEPDGASDERRHRGGQQQPPDDPQNQQVEPPGGREHFPYRCDVDHRTPSGLHAAAAPQTQY